MRRKRKAKTQSQRAFDVCEQALKDSVKRRDKVCQICKSDKVLQADHAIISRQHKATFFELRQMLLLCAACHTKKTFKQQGFDVIVHDLVTQREGREYITWLLSEAKKIKKWTVMDLQEKTSELNMSFN